MRRKKIKFSNQCQDVPVIKLTLGNGKDIYALVDTGSESTIIDKTTIKESKDLFHIIRKSEKTSFIGVAGNTEVPIVEASTTVTISGESLNLNGIVMDLSHITKDSESIKLSVILGCHLLKELEAKLDFKDKSIMLNNDLSSQ